DIRDSSTLGGWHLVQAAQNLVAVRLGTVNAFAVAAGHARNVVAGGRGRDARKSARRAGPTQPRTTLFAHGAALLTVEDVARVGDGIVGNVDEVAITRLTKDVAPIVAIRP